MKKNLLVGAVALICLLSTSYVDFSFDDSPLVLQKLNYNENPVDIPNPDRGFYKAAEFVVPVDKGTPVVPELATTIAGTKVPVETRIIYMEFDLRNFSSNAPLNGKPIGPWSESGARKPDYGTTQPLTPAALDYVRAALQKVRESDAVAIVKFNYDGRGHTYVDNDRFNQLIHDCEPGAPKGRMWYETGEVNKSDLCNVPGHENLNWVQYHLLQLGSVFTEFDDCIMVVKAGMFGPWGKMHSSSYARTKEGYHWLLNAFLGYVPPSRSILVHAGGVMAWHNVEYNTHYSFTNLMPAPKSGTPAQRFGMFNDSYSAGSSGGSSYNDNGSLSEGYALIGNGSESDFNRNAALNWIRNQNNFYGGESVGPGADDNIYPRMPNVLYEAAYARTTHLNTGWNHRTYKLWGDFVYNKKNVTTPYTPPHDGVSRTAIFDPLYEGRSGMEYMRDRLGYRLVLREAKVASSVKLNGVLKFEGKIQNVGFGNIINKKKVSVILKNGSAVYSAATDVDVREWQSDLDSRADNKKAWRDLKFSVDMKALGAVPAGNYNIFLKINDPKETSTNKRCIRFANHDTWNSDLGANLIGEVDVVK